jgi:Kef-type K+ transport system membrane component KefB
MSNDGIEWRDVLHVKRGKDILTIVSLIVPVIITAIVAGLTFGLGWIYGLSALIGLTIVSFIFISVYNDMCPGLMSRNFEKIQ